MRRLLAATTLCPVRSLAGNRDGMRIRRRILGFRDASCTARLDASSGREPRCPRPRPRQALSPKGGVKQAVAKTKAPAPRTEGRGGLTVGD